MSNQKNNYAEAAIVRIKLENFVYVKTSSSFICVWLLNLNKSMAFFYYHFLALMIP